MIRLYSLTQNGLLKIFDLVETTLESNFDFRVSHGSYVLDNLPDNTNLFKLTFKSFEILSEDKLILICNHQSFVILYDVNEGTKQRTHMSFIKLIFKLMTTTTKKIRNLKADLNQHESLRNHELYQQMR